MVKAKTKAYQEKVFVLLKNLFGNKNVEIEWSVAKESTDAFTRELYRPRLDLAIGPFNNDGNVDLNKQRIETAISKHQDLILGLFNHSEFRSFDINDFLAKKNENPRCFLAIEIENSGSSKHMLGNIANVSILGSIGIVVPFNQNRLSLCKRIKKYFSFAAQVGKIDDVFQNVLIINKDKFWGVIKDFSAK